MKVHHTPWILLLCFQLLWTHVQGRWHPFRSTDDTIFVPGTIPVDTDGNQINAHEGWILQIEDSYLWYGTSHKVNTTDPSTGTWDWVSGSINLFVSHDLSTWRRKAPVFSASAIMAAADKMRGPNAAGPYRIEQPKVLYNSARRYYVLIFHLDTIDMRLAQVGWATSPSPYGPFSFQQSSQPDGLGSLDLNVATTGDAPDVYLVRSVPGGSISISKLSKDCLDTTGVCSSLQLNSHATPVSVAAAIAEAAVPGAAIGGLVPAAAAARATATATPVARAASAATSRGDAGAGSAASNTAAVGMAAGTKTGTGAAPCLFRYDGRWYLLASEHPGWEPSGLHLFVTDADDPCGTSWTQVQHAATGPGSHTGFDSTPAFVFSYQFPGSSQVLPVYFGDRWNAQGPGSVASASYVWLPFVEAGSPKEPAALQLVNPGESWRLGDYRRAMLPE